MRNSAFLRGLRVSPFQPALIRCLLGTHGQFSCGDQNSGGVVELEACGSHHDLGRGRSAGQRRHGRAGLGEGNTLRFSLDRGDLWDERPSKRFTEVRDRFNWRTMQQLVASNRMAEFNDNYTGVCEPREGSAFPHGVKTLRRSGSASSAAGTASCASGTTSAAAIRNGAAQT